jgi:two-component system sensor histidine kinase TctE
VDRASALANQMLSLAKVEQLRQQQDFRVIDWMEVVRSVALDLSPLIAQKDIYFEIFSEPCPVHAHDWMLREMVRNLLHNAIRHTPPHGRLEIWIGPADSQARLVISDSGSGIDEKLRLHLYQPFASGSTHSGTGLGLTIVREIAVTLGGYIQMDNRMRDGVVYGLDAIVCLPLDSTSTKTS